MAANLFERRAEFLGKLLALNVAQLKAREAALKGKADRSVDEDEETLMIAKSIALMGEDKENPDRSLGAWIVKMLLNAE
jgi:hypothetical protein